MAKRSIAQEDRQAELLAQAEANVAAVTGEDPPAVPAPEPAQPGTLLECLKLTKMPWGGFAGPGWAVRVERNRLVYTNPKGVEREHPGTFGPGFVNRMVAEGNFKKAEG